MAPADIRSRYLWNRALLRLRAMPVLVEGVNSSVQLKVSDRLLRELATAIGHPVE